MNNQIKFLCDLDYQLTPEVERYIAKERELRDMTNSRNGWRFVALASVLISLVFIYLLA